MMEEETKGLMQDEYEGGEQEVNTLAHANSQVLNQQKELFQITEQEQEQLDKIRVMINDLLAPMEQDTGSITIERKDKEYMLRRKAVLLSNIVKDTKDEKLQMGWNLIQTANEAELQALRNSTN